MPDTSLPQSHPPRPSPRVARDESVRPALQAKKGSFDFAPGNLCAFEYGYICLSAMTHEAYDVYTPDIFAKFRREVGHNYGSARSVICGQQTPNASTSPSRKFWKRHYTPRHSTSSRRAESPHFGLFLRKRRALTQFGDGHQFHSLHLHKVARHFLYLYLTYNSKLTNSRCIMSLVARLETQLANDPSHSISKKGRHTWTFYKLDGVWKIASIKL
jgi:hypothetical protein